MRMRLSCVIIVIETREMTSCRTILFRRLTDLPGYRKAEFISFFPLNLHTNVPLFELVLRK